MYGADTQQLRGLASTLSGAADELRTTTLRLTAAIDKTGWLGQDAENLKGRWRASSKGRLVAAADQLDGAVEALRKNAEEQDRASGITPGTIGDSTLVPLDLTSGLGGTTSAPESVSWLDRAVGMNGFLQSFDTITGLTTDAFDLAGLGLSTPVSTNMLGGIPLLGGAVAATDYLVNANKYGFGSPEATVSAVDGTIATVVSIVPGGSLAYAGGKYIGEVILDTPLGDKIESELFINDYLRDIDALGGMADEAVAAGDFERATALNEMAREQAAEVNEKISGFSGVLNVGKSVVGSLFPW